MNRLAFLSFTCQLGQEGERGSLVNTATPDTHDSGKRPIPHKLVAPLCAATGSNLLRQFIDLQRALDGVSEVERLAAILLEAA